MPRFCSQSFYLASLKGHPTVLLQTNVLASCQEWLVIFQHVPFSNLDLDLKASRNERSFRFCSRARESSGCGRVLRDVLTCLNIYFKLGSSPKSLDSNVSSFIFVADFF